MQSSKQNTARVPRAMQGPARQALACTCILAMLLATGFLLLAPYLHHVDPFPQRLHQNGVVYFGYSLDASKLEEYVQTINSSVARLKLHSPMLPVAVFTNAAISDTELASYAFDQVIRIAEATVLPGRQWWTRLIHLNHTPFEYTLLIDSDRAVCGDVSDIFRLLEGYDMLGVPAGIYPAFDNGVIAYKKGPLLNTLIASWMREQTAFGQDRDDQHTLARAIDGTPNVSVGMLPAIWQAKRVPARGDHWGPDTKLARSLVLRGAIKIMAAQTCSEMLMQTESPRVWALHRGKAPKDRMVFSQAECEEFLDGTCGHQELDWDAHHDVMTRTEYMNRYSG